MSADIRLGRWQDVLTDVTCDALICDPPYSARTHEASTDEALNGSGRVHGRAYEQRKSADRVAGKRTTIGKQQTQWERNWLASGGERRALNYDAWTPDDVRAFVASWAPRTRGWFVAFTSHDLCPVYAEALEAAGRYVFAPLPWFSPGSRVRLSGDGPSSWTCWIMVARPRHAPYAKWGTLPGGYQTTPEACEVVGGKPIGLMQAIVRDYSRPGDLVCDPFLGSGTTAVAALAEGRRFVGSEQKPEHYEIAKRRISRGYTPSMF